MGPPGIPSPGGRFPITGLGAAAALCGERRAQHRGGGDGHHSPPTAPGPPCPRVPNQPRNHRGDPKQTLCEQEGSAGRTRCQPLLTKLGGRDQAWGDPWGPGGAGRGPRPPLACRPRPGGAVKGRNVPVFRLGPSATTGFNLEERRKGGNLALPPPPGGPPAAPRPPQPCGEKGPRLRLKGASPGDEVGAPMGAAGVEMGLRGGSRGSPCTWVTALPGVGGTGNALPPPPWWGLNWGPPATQRCRVAMATGGGVSAPPAASRSGGRKQGPGGGTRGMQAGGDPTPLHHGGDPRTLLSLLSLLPCTGQTPQ